LSDNGQLSAESQAALAKQGINWITQENQIAGVDKKGLADIRKAFKTHVTAKAIALYVDNKPVGFAKFDSEDIGHASREGVLAYDISAYQDKIDAFDDAINQTKSEWEKKYSPSKTKSTTILSKESIDYSRARDAAGNYKTYIHKHVGEITSTAMLSKFIDLIMNFGEVTFKLVIAEDRKKRLDRTNNKPISREYLSLFNTDLKTRLAKYKLSKKPTASNIEDFLKAAEKGIGVIQFAGSSYHLQKSAYQDIEPVQLLNGKSFTIRYKTATPGHYHDVEVEYSFDKTNGMLMPLTVKWSDKNSGEDFHKVLNKPTWLRNHKVGIDNKANTIKELLTLFKAENFNKVKDLIGMLRDDGADWPELATIEKSIDIEKKKAAEKKA
jgi:hypothetical protein